MRSGGESWAFVNARDLLARHPNIGRERSELRGGLRSWSVYPFTIFYKVAARPRVLTIERVIHGRMEIDEDDFPN